MTHFAYDFDHVQRMTVNTIGPPGRRVFYLQARHGEHLLTMLAEKEQIRALVTAAEQLLDQLGEQDPLLATSADMLVADMRLEEPIEPAFRVVQIGLGYDRERDMVLVLVHGRTGDRSDVTLARIATSRQQMRALSTHGARVVAAGRPTCHQYLRPCDYRQRGEEVCPFCPDRN